MENPPEPPDSSNLQQIPPGKPAATAPVSWWWLVSALAAALVLGIGGLELVRLLARPIGLLILAISIASALAPVVNWLSGRFPRGLAVILVYAVLLLLIIAILTATVPLLVGQIRGLFEHLRVWIPQITSWLGQFGFDPQGLRNSLLSGAGQAGMIFLRLPIGVFTLLVDIVLILFLSLYWTFLSPNIKRFFLSFFPVDEKGFVSQIVAQMGTEMGGYLRGAAINGILIGAAKFIGLLIIGVPYALTLGALAAFMELFPTIGPIASGAVATLVALSVSPRTALVTVIFAVALQQTEGHILVPLIMRSQTKISPLLAIFSIVAGAAVGGLLGAVIAIPIASVLSVFIRTVIAPAIRRANGVKAEEI